jgi:hypothetical protein
VAAVQQFLSSDKTVSINKKAIWQWKHVKEMFILYMVNYLGYGANNLGDVNVRKRTKYGYDLFILHMYSAVLAKLAAKS